jgi:hypothetical protein
MIFLNFLNDLLKVYTKLSKIFDNQLDFSKKFSLQFWQFHFKVFTIVY